MSRPQVAYAATRPLFDQGSYLSDALLGWRLIPNYQVYDKSKENILFETDPFGFRNPHHKLPPSGKLMLLGDSFVQGYYLSEEESIRGQLQNQWPGYIYNFGVGGYSTDQEFLVGKAALERFTADWMVLFFYNNDLPYLTETTAWKMRKSKFVIDEGRIHFDKIVSRPFAEFNGPVFPERDSFPIRRRVRQHPGYHANGRELFSALWGRELETWGNGILGGSVETGSHLELWGQRGIRSYQDPEVLSTDWNLAFQFFRELRRIGAQKGTQLLVFHIPELAQIKAGERYFAPQMEFQRRCAEMKLHCLEPHQIYAERAKNEALYFIDDGHFAPRGAALAADLVSQYIKGQRMAAN